MYTTKTWPLPLCRAPKTVLDFFKPKTAGEAAAGAGHDGGFGAVKLKRKSEDALSEIHVNRAGAHTKHQKRTGVLSLYNNYSILLSHDTLTVQASSWALHS